MRTGELNGLHKLEPGQLWRIEHRYLYIVELGKRLIWYKMVRHPNARAAITQMIGIESLLNYLRLTDAELVSSEAVFAMHAMTANGEDRCGLSSEA